MAGEENRGGFFDYEHDDTTYGGAPTLVEQEQDRLREARGLDDKHRFTGLAVSGGGIRSATFALGLLQALASRDRLRGFDYLSTVSGGGYIGSALSWLFHRPWKLGKEDVRFGPGQAEFGYGVMDEPPGDGHREERRFRRLLLRHLRQHGKYLTPGHGITLWSLIAVVLRGAAVSLLVYLPLLGLLVGLLFWGVGKATGHPPVDGDIMGPLMIAGVITVVGVAISLLYALATYWSLTGKMGLYRKRRWFEVMAGGLLVGLLLSLVLTTLPYVHHWLQGKLGGIDWLNPGYGVGGALTAIGALLGGSSWKSTAAKIRGLPLTLQVWIGSFALIYGFLLIAFALAYRMVWSPVPWSPGLVAWLGGALLLGWFNNLNYLSVHRFYRDRLMETYMPDVEGLLAGEQVRVAAGADKARLHDLYPEKGTWERPYHIVNTNLVLVDSPVAKFKARGGDNFILSPLFSGSSATGWQPTAEFMGGGMTLSTAMAISGAAANPNTGVGGEGPTRNPLLSTLMSLLNLRLGYWVPNPRKVPFHKPNLISPGVGEITRQRLNETGRFVQLSDGGHFENLALYELIRRRVKLIVCSDAGADPKFEFGDLGNLVEKVRVDFGVVIEIDTSPLAPGGDKDKPQPAQAGHVVGTIHYPGEKEPGRLIFVKPTWLAGLPVDVEAYKRVNAVFPNQPTSDQFFDERQFEAYRELGYQQGLRMLQDPQVEGLLGGGAS